MSENNRTQHRKFKNVLIEPFKQLRIGISLIVLNIMFGLASAAAFYYYISNYYSIVSNMLKLFKLPEGALLGLENQATTTQHQVIIVLAVMCLVFIILTTVVVLRITHRMYGPIRAINNYLSRSASGENPKPLELRSKDDFQHTADLINELVQKQVKPK